MRYEKTKIKIIKRACLSYRSVVTAYLNFTPLTIKSAKVTKEYNSGVINPSIGADKMIHAIVRIHKKLGQKEIVFSF